VKSFIENVRIKIKRIMTPFFFYEVSAVLRFGAGMWKLAGGYPCRHWFTLSSP